jgi:carbamoyltransferase
MSPRTNILGISAFYHDSAACLVQNGEIIAAAQEERFTRKKHDASFPRHAVEYCLREGSIGLKDLDYVAFYEKPFIKFDRILHSYLAYAPAGLPSFLKAIPVWIKEKIWMKALIAKELGGYEGKLIFPEHHESHAASAFFPSPYPEAAFLTVDGVGEWTTTSFGTGKGGEIDILHELHFPHSLGLLYSAFTYYTGFKVNSGEYKLMGLAPYGEPAYKDLILRELIDLKEDGSFRLNMRYFNHGVGLTMINGEFERLFGGPARKPESRLTQRDMDLARSIQEVTGEILFRMARHVRQVTGLKQLCLAGGVALNCVGNGKVLREGPFRSLWIQPAAGDAGGAVGVALSAWHRLDGQPRVATGARDGMRGGLLGPAYSNEEIELFLARQNAPYVRVSEEDLFGQIADDLAAGKIIGWFQGRMEFGPRALGGRSILGDARNPRMQSVMNLKIKYRESFRPFAPSVLRERLSDYFEMDADSPYMLLVAPVLAGRRTPLTDDQRDLWGIELLNVPRSDIPAVTHVDYSARIQTVDATTSPRYHALIRAFEARTGCAAIVNTSFNVRGEPIVCTPADAYRCFMRTEIDVLVLENCVLQKADQKPLVGDGDWRAEYELD